MCAPRVIVGQVVAVPDEPGCDSCRLVVGPPLVVLGPADGPGVLSGMPAAVARDSYGRLWVFDGSTPPLVFDTDGRYIGAVGRRGQGPGEFLSPVHAFPVPGDSMVVVDAALQRATVIGPDLSPSRTISFRPLPVISGAVLEWPGRVALHAPAFSQDLGGWPLHLASLAQDTTEIEASFGHARGDPARPHPAVLATLLARGPSGQLWSAERYRYQLMAWDPAGRMLSTIRRQPDWFSARSVQTEGNPETAPGPRIWDVVVDVDGYLWVAVHIPSSEWRKAWGSGGQRSGGETSTHRIEPRHLYTSLIEVIDPGRGRVIARGATNRYVAALLPGEPSVVFYEETADGIPQLHVAPIAVRGRR